MSCVLHSDQCHFIPTILLRVQHACLSAVTLCSLFLGADKKADAVAYHATIHQSDSAQGCGYVLPLVMPVLWQWRDHVSSEDSSKSSSSSSESDVPLEKKVPNAPPLPPWIDESQSDSDTAAHCQHPAGKRPRLAPPCTDSSSEESDSTSSNSSSCVSLADSLTGQLTQQIANLQPEAIAAMYGGTSSQKPLPNTLRRTKEVLECGGGCRCRKKCGLQFATKSALRRVAMCIALFWALPKQGQDALLWSLAHTKQATRDSRDTDDGDGERPRATRRSWMLDGRLAAQ